MVDGISVREDVAELFNQMDFVFGFLDDGVEPQTHVGGHHVHQTEMSQRRLSQLELHHLNKNTYSTKLRIGLKLVISTFALRKMKYIWRKVKII